MSKKRISLSHIPPKHHEGIGLVSNAWSLVEGAVERIVWRLAGVTDDNVGIAITTHMGIKARLDVACALANYRFPDFPETKNLKKLSREICGPDMYGKRNEIIHSRVLDLSMPGVPALRLTYKARGKIQRNLKEAKISEYEELVERYLRTADQLLSILDTFLRRMEKNVGR